jgi:chlorophyllase-like protein
MSLAVVAQGSFVVAVATLVSACSAAPRPEAPAPVDAGSGDVIDSAVPSDAPAAARDSALPPDGTLVDTGHVVSSDGGTRYGSDGPVGYTTAAFPVTNGSDSFTVNVWVPSTPGSHPVVSFSPGLEQPCAGYTPYATRLASWGFVVLMRNDPGILVSGDTVASDLSYTVGTWLPAQNAMSASVLYGKADLSHVGLAGHSRGGQTTLVAAEEGLHGKIQAWVGLDPVNTAYSAGTAPSMNLPSIGVPTLYIGAGVATNCAPVGDDYQTLYAVSPSPSIAITVANASHPQFEDLGGCSVCGLACSPMGTANSEAVLDDAIRYLTAYFARELLGDSSVGPLFQGAGAPADEASGAITIVSK